MCEFHCFLRGVEDVAPYKLSIYVCTDQKAPLCKGSCRAYARLRGCSNVILILYNPSVTAKPCHLPLHKGGCVSKYKPVIKRFFADFLSQEREERAGSSRLRIEPWGSELAPSPTYPIMFVQTTNSGHPERRRVSRRSRRISLSLRNNHGIPRFRP